MLRPLGEVLPEEIVQSEGRAPVALLISTVSINRNEPLTVIWEQCLISLMMAWGWTYQCCNCVTLPWLCIIFQMLKDNWDKLPHLCSAWGFCEILSWWKFEVPHLFCLCLECWLTLSGTLHRSKSKTSEKRGSMLQWEQPFLARRVRDKQQKREVEKRRQAK